MNVLEDHVKLALILKVTEKIDNERVRHHLQDHDFTFDVVNLLKPQDLALFEDLERMVLRSLQVLDQAHATKRTGAQCCGHFEVREDKFLLRLASDGCGGGTGVTTAVRISRLFFEGYGFKRKRKGVDISMEPSNQRQDAEVRSTHLLFAEHGLAPEKGPPTTPS